VSERQPDEQVRLPVAERLRQGSQRAGPEVDGAPSRAAGRQSRSTVARGPAGRQRRGRPAKLSRPAIFAAAVELIDRGGPEALTMRSLASALDVEAMSLYRYVDGRDALLDGVAEQLMSEIEPRGASSDWVVAVRGYAGSIRGLARNHPQAFTMVALRALDSPSALQPVEDLLASLRRAGFTPARAVAAFRTIAAFTQGYVLSEIAGFALPEETASAERVGGRFPAIRSLARPLASEPSDQGFRTALDTLIRGLQAEREPS
jgi:AcrR family transcriptional regulator